MGVGDPEKDLDVDVPMTDPGLETVVADRRGDALEAALELTVTELKRQRPCRDPLVDAAAFAARVEGDEEDDALGREVVEGVRRKVADPTTLGGERHVGGDRRRCLGWLRQPRRDVFQPWAGTKPGAKEAFGVAAAFDGLTQRPMPNPSAPTARATAAARL